MQDSAWSNGSSESFGFVSGDELASTRKARPPLSSVKPSSRVSPLSNGLSGSRPAQTAKPRSVHLRHLPVHRLTTISAKLPSTTTTRRTPRPAFEPVSAFDSKPRPKGKEKPLIAHYAPPRPDLAMTSASNVKPIAPTLTTVALAPLAFRPPPHPIHDVNPITLRKKPLSSSSMLPPSLPIASTSTHKPVPRPPPQPLLSTSAPHTPKKHTPISRTTITRLTDVIHNPSSASAELLGLHVLQNGVPEAPVGYVGSGWEAAGEREMRSRLEVSPQKVGGYGGGGSRSSGRTDGKGKGPKFLRCVLSFLRMGYVVFCQLYQPRAHRHHFSSPPSLNTTP